MMARALNNFAGNFLLRKKMKNRKSPAQRLHVKSTCGKNWFGGYWDVRIFPKERRICVGLENCFPSPRFPPYKKIFFTTQHFLLKARNAHQGGWVRWDNGTGWEHKHKSRSLSTHWHTLGCVYCYSMESWARLFSSLCRFLNNKVPKNIFSSVPSFDSDENIFSGLVFIPIRITQSNGCCF